MLNRNTTSGFPLTTTEVRDWVQQALAEDRANEDVTTIATVQKTRRARAMLVARQAGVIAGSAFAVEAFHIMDESCAIRVDAADGRTVTKGECIMFVSGHARPMLAAERVALNFLQRLSGIATLTRRYVDAIEGCDARILDTRKTTPGWRKLEKYAVRCGGGANHRLDLASAILIKDNHLAALDGDIARAVGRARALSSAEALVEVECESLDQVEAAVAAGADIILLDNMSPAMLRSCVKRVAGRCRTEASGGVTLDNVRAIAETGVDFISVGALTHSVPAMNLALDFE
jgi:nicotinate-nucleotide pyrophosphorylase (carboxylating)